MATEWNSPVRLLTAVAVLSFLTVGTVAACGGKSPPATPPVSATSSSVTTSAAPATKDVAPTTVPPSAWINPARAPLADTEHWPDLAAVAEPLTDGTSRIYQLCQTNPAPAATWGGTGVDAARALVDNGADRWSLQQQIIHYPGDTWTMGQTAHALFSSLEHALTNCAATGPGARATITTPATHCGDMQRSPCTELAATIEVPDKHVTAHIYLSAPGSSVTELTVWSSGSPRVAWPAPSDSDVFAALNAQLCTVWEC